MILKYQTARLNVFEVANDLAQFDSTELLACVIALLSPAVVKNLPPYFHNINSVIDAQKWLARMVTESRLFVIEHKDASSKIGFIFAYSEQGEQNKSGDDAHIGYLLGEDHWRQGLASELLTGFIEFSLQEQQWGKLIAGVAQDNSASSNLLEKLGFTPQPASDNQVIFYQYQLT